jgi:phosphatidylserine/phosphatidylglycerophosphate/cardiolipin synthase-like enzyme
MTTSHYRSFLERKGIMSSMKREMTLTLFALGVFMVVMTGSLFTAIGSPLQQLDPTEQEGTVQAVVEGYFQATQDAQLQATADVRFQQLLQATRAASPDAIVRTEYAFGAAGYVSDWWQVYFTSPAGTNDRSQWSGGIDVAVAEAISNVSDTLDIAAFELNNETITQAIIDAHDRGVTVRIVTDDEHGVEDDDTTIIELEAEGIPIVDDAKSALMHNKFMIMDSTTVWMGSMNYTMNGNYRNNNNVLVIRAPEMVEAYQAEFDEMFIRNEFGVTSTSGNGAQFEVGDALVEVYFASEDNVADQIVEEINNAQEQIRFMAFSFTENDIGDPMLARLDDGISIEGVFENTGSLTRFSELTKFYCAGLDVRQDGNAGILHHKVIIIDDDTVITGSFNFSGNAIGSNDENVVIITQPDIASLYIEEYERVKAIAEKPEDGEVTCE